MSMFGGRQVIDEGALRNFREFLEIYNQMSELCFNRCIDNLHSVTLTKGEIDCSDLCAGKHMTVNHKVLSAFMVEQPKITEQRIEDAQKEALKLAEAQSKAQEQQQQQ